MTRDDIYDHLAQVYLGKKNQIKEQKKKQFNAWLLINIVITCVIFASAVYGLTAFLTHKGDALQNRVIYSLSNGPIRIKYNLAHPFPPVKRFSLEVPQINAAKYKSLEFAVRGMDEGYPGILRVELKNKKQETSSVVVKNVRLDWQRFNIPFDRFEEITDWSNIDEVIFVLESWNIEKEKGIILIDDVCFSS